MTWVPKQSVTSGEVAHAKSLLPPNPAWRIGVIEEQGVIQYRGAMHPNASGEGSHPGVEVWTEKEAKPVTEDLGTTSPDERELVLAAAEAQGYPREEVYSTIQIESAWKPHNWYHGAAPEKAAGGLIGFMPFVLKALGWTGTPQEFRAQSSGEQAPWVGKYFAQVKGQWKYPGDTYVAVAAGGFVGRPDGTPVYVKGTKAYDWNKVWDTDKDGVITVGDLRRVLLTRMKGIPADLPVPKEPGAEPSSPVYYLSVSAQPSRSDLATIRYNSRNNHWLVLVQSTLKGKGLYKGSLDGDFGPLTAQALKEFTDEKD